VSALAEPVPTIAASAATITANSVYRRTAELLPGRRPREWAHARMSAHASEQTLRTLKQACESGAIISPARREVNGAG
jgi:hypothetical protein